MTVLSIGACFNTIIRKMYYIERFLVDSRVEHLRQYERMKVADHSIQEHALAFHIDKRPPISRILLQVLSKAIAREG
jgi:hypothetical protein